MFPSIQHVALVRPCLGDESTEVVTLTGVRFDTIRKAGQSWEREVGKNFNLHARMQDLLRLSPLSVRTYGGETALHEVIWRTPIADLEVDRSDGSSTAKGAD